jgi:hypothetical protein
VCETGEDEYRREKDTTREDYSQAPLRVERRATTLESPSNVGAK